MNKKLKNLSKVTLGLAAVAVYSQLHLQNAAGDPPADPPPVANMPEDVAPLDDVPSDPPDTPDIPTPPDTPPACPYSKGVMSYTGWDHGGSRVSPFDGSDETNRCVKAWLDSIGRSCRAHEVYCDDKKSNAVAKLFFGDKISQTLSTREWGRRGDHTLFNPNIQLPNGAFCQESAIHHFDYGRDWITADGGNVTVKTACIKGHFYFDAGCSLVDPAIVRAACGDEPPVKFQIDIIKSSPISLLWTPEADIENGASVSSFPLNPTRSDKWYAWRASEDTPLLVYDPSRSGSIKSGEQLFGNWTFGGRRTASLSARAGSIGQPWNDGYEALASLDRNGDRKLSGEELAALSLWFDRNRDSVSQPGEVKTLSEVGVTALFVTPDNRGSGEQHVFASKGYERELNGRIVSGGSVDWFAESADSPYELTAGLTLSKSVETAPAEIRPDVEQIVKDGYATENSGPSVDGVWAWQFDDQRLEAEVNVATKGLLVFDAREDTAIQGYSLLVSPFEKTPKKVAAGKMTALYVAGTRSGNSISFAPVASTRGARIKSEATLSDDGQTLKGKSVASYDSEKGLKTLTYSWTARRVR